MSHYEIVSIIGIVVSLCFVAIGLIYTSRQINLLQQTNRAAHEWNRRKAAQDIAISFGELNPKHLLIRELHNKRDYSGVLSADELNEEFEQNNDLRHAINDILNYYEYLALGIKQGVYDEKLIKKFWGNAIINSYHRYREYINNYRKEARIPTIWEVMEEYAVRWEREKHISPDRELTG